MCAEPSLFNVMSVVMLQAASSNDKLITKKRALELLNNREEVMINYFEKDFSPGPVRDKLYK